MVKKSIFILVFVALATISLLAQEETNSDEYTPSGKPFAKLFTNFHNTHTDGKDFSQFELTRVYLGYQYSFSENFSAKANFDIGNPESGNLEMSAYVKNAFVQYKNKGLTANFGLIGTTIFKLQEDVWGNRYMFKMFADQYKMGHSADLGANVSYKFCDFFSADVAVFNGEGYKKLEGDSTLKYAAGVTITPMKNFYIRAFYDHMKKESAQQTLAFFVGYKGPKFTAGAEYNSQLNHDMEEGQDYSGYSVYGSYAFKKVRVYGRYDNVTSVTYDNEMDPWNISKDGQQIIAGIEFSPVKGIKISPNYQLWSPAKSTAPAITGAFLSLEIKY